LRTIVLVFENSPLAEVAVGRSTVRQRILELLVGGNVTRLHLREIQRRVGTSPGTASRELARLVAAGLVDREAEGSQVYFRASDRPIAGIMRQLMLAQREIPAPEPAPRVPRARRSRARQGATAPAAPPEASTQPAAPTLPEAASGAVPVEPEAPLDAAPAAAAVLPDAPVATIPDPLALVVAARFGAAIRQTYGTRLQGVFVYGARSSSPAPEDADVELVVALDAVERYGDELERTSALCAQLSYELGLVVSRVFVTAHDWTPPQDVVSVLPAEDSR
jgi:DNA-binding transcriptional ArsR family regulator